MIEAKKNFDLKTSVWKTNLDSLRTETAQKIEEYEKQAPKLSTKERLLFEQLIQSKQEQLMNYQKVVEENIAREDQQFSEGVMNRINSYIKNFGDKRKYKVILGTSEYGNILYGKEDENITEEILKGLNEEFDKGL
jgi:outer membrane protein